LRACLQFFQNRVDPENDVEFRFHDAAVLPMDWGFTMLTPPGNILAQ
jgi:hypothetical protein